MEIKKVAKQVAVVAGIAAVTLFVINWLAGRTVPVASAVAKKIATG